MLKSILTSSHHAQLNTLVAKNGGILPFQWRGLKSIANCCFQSPYKNCYFLIDLIFHELFHQIRNWIKDYFWKIARLFFISIIKEDKVYCPISSLSRDILKIILEYVGLMNTQTYPSFIDSLTLDKIFLKNLPSFLYRNLVNFQTYQAIESQLQNFSTEGKQNFYQIQPYFRNKILFQTVSNISKRIADFSLGSVIYLSAYLEIISEKIFLLANRISQSPRETYLSVLFNDDFCSFLDKFDFNLDWKWLLEGFFSFLIFK